LLNNLESPNLYLSLKVQTKRENPLKKVLQQYGWKKSLIQISQFPTFKFCNYWNFHLNKFHFPFLPIPRKQKP
jgi:hypothetical protein